MKKEMIKNECFLISNKPSTKFILHIVEGLRVIEKFIILSGPACGKQGRSMFY